MINMSEDLLVKHCSPTLAGLKTGNLFNCSCSSEKEAQNFVNTYNKILSKKGIKLILLNYSNNRALLYLYRKNKLKSDLSTPYAEFLLRMQGYNSIDVESCIAQLKRRVKTSSEFPHEIGLFLGYPPEDVYGFICNKGACSKCTGCWKVYGDEKEALKKFAKFKKCSRIYYLKWKQGFSLEKLTVSA